MTLLSARRGATPRLSRGFSPRRMCSGSERVELWWGRVFQGGWS